MKSCPRVTVVEPGVAFLFCDFDIMRFLIPTLLLSTLVVGCAAKEPVNYAVE